MIGRVVGNYRIVDRLGDGGMGSVYRAVDRMLDREVAIKVLRPDLARKEALVERFRQEAKALARLSHPRIATLHGLEQHGDELLMIMEFVRGDTLEAIVERSGRITWPRACELCIAVLDALDHAHDMGVVHRDIKPANVMLAHNGAVKVMDFGIARMLGRSRQTQVDTRWARRCTWRPSNCAVRKWTAAPISYAGRGGALRTHHGPHGVRRRFGLCAHDEETQ